MESTGTARKPRSLAVTCALVAIVLLMIAGSVTLWIASPIFWLWLTGRLQATQPAMWPYVLMLSGILVTSIAVGKGLAALNRLYARTSRSDATVRIHLPWHRMRGGEHEPKLHPVTVLDAVMVISVVVAVIALFAFYFIENPSPIAPGPAKD